VRVGMGMGGFYGIFSKAVDTGFELKSGVWGD